LQQAPPSQNDEWAELISDAIVNKANWKVSSMRKVVDDMATIRDDFKAIEEVLEATMGKRAEHHAELLRIARERYPQGIPREGSMNQSGAATKP
jgi:hypothetical protein